MGLRPVGVGNSGIVGIVDKGVALLDRKICAGRRRVRHFFAGRRLLRTGALFRVHRQGRSKGSKMQLPSGPKESAQSMEF
jgi:hypothetical protein